MSVSRVLFISDPDGLSDSASSPIDALKAAILAQIDVYIDPPRQSPVSPDEIWSLQVCRVEDDRAPHEDASGDHHRLLWYRGRTFKAQWRWADSPDWLPLNGYPSIVDQIVAWLQSGQSEEGTEGQLEHLIRLIEGLCGWVDVLLTRNAHLERFLQEANEASRHNAQLKADLAEVEKTLAQAQAQVEALSMESKKRVLDPRTTSATVTAMKYVGKGAATLLLTFVGTYAGTIAARAPTSGVSQASLTRQLAEVRSEIDDRCNRINAFSGPEPRWFVEPMFKDPAEQFEAAPPAPHEQGHQQP